MLLRELSDLNGVSGNEKAVRDYIIEQLKTKTDSYQTDRVGNLLAEKKGRPSSTQKPRVAISAHMDEVGLFITEITGEGYLKFQTVGYIDINTLVSKPILINDKVPGVIGVKAIHLQQPEECRQNFLLEQLYIDIGAASKDEAEQQVKLGDFASFTTRFEPFGQDLYKGKAMDDRAGCAVILELLEHQYPCDLTAVFTVQEELGLRGSKVISNYLEADLAIVIEATSALDIQEHDRENWNVVLGQGPACSLMDTATIYKPELIRKTAEIAAKNGIPIQFRESTAAANDAGNIHLARTGTPTITLSIPCRYLHSMASVIAAADYNHCRELVRCMLEEIEEYMNLLQAGLGGGHHE